MFVPVLLMKAMKVRMAFLVVGPVASQVSMSCWVQVAAVLWWVCLSQSGNLTVSVISCLAECTGPRALVSGVVVDRMRRRWCHVAKCSTGLATCSGKGQSLSSIQDSNRARCGSW